MTFKITSAIRQDVTSHDGTQITLHSPKGASATIYPALGFNCYSWIVPYYRLVTYSNKRFSIHSNGHFIKFKKNRNYRNNKKFLAKMIDMKINHLKLDYYDV